MKAKNQMTPEEFMNARREADAKKQSAVRNGAPIRPKKGRKQQTG
jgi:hypothetical protein